MGITTYAQLEEQAKHWRHEMAGLANNRAVSFAFWDVAQPRGHVLIVPGRNERALKYTEVASEWADRGISTLCLSPNPEIESFQNYIDEFQYVFDQVWKPRVKGQFALVQGHSTGAHTAARCLATGYRHVEGADGFIMSAPLAGMNYRVPYVPDPVAATVVGFMGAWSPDNYALGQKAYSRDQWPFDGNRWTSSRERYQWMLDMFDAHPEHAPHGAKWGWVLAAQRSCNLLDRVIDKLELPQLLLATPNDRAVSGPAQSKFTRATRVDFPDSGHEIFMERDSIRNRAWAAIDDFVFKLRQNPAP